MKCSKCNGLMVYEPPTYEGEQGSARCMICGNRIWEPRKVVMAEIPSPDKERPATVTSIQNHARRNELLLEMAKIDKQERLAVA